MKNLKVIFSSFLILIFAVSVVLFSTCEKEDIEPTPIQGVENSDIHFNLDLLTLTGPDLESQNEFAIPITVTYRESKCGYTLSVSSTEANLSDVNYIISWYKKPDREAFFVGQSLPCVCGFPARVEVKDDSGNMLASGLFEIPSCQ